MQKFYRVKSKYYLSQARAEFEYTWFVYQRSQPDTVLEESIPTLKTHSQTDPRQNFGTAANEFETNKKPLATSTEQKLLSEFFSLAEACQLITLLADVFNESNTGTQVINSIEEVVLPDVSPTETCLLHKTYQSSGSFVAPEDFAALEENHLNFQVAAAIAVKPVYMASDFLGNLSEARLEALRKMHLENNG
ncbi:MAG TPA: hypothetical protein VH186_04000 [Chloroflexia bacterium]|nr:hypothetical protein [Chloroflexia bacterium]